MGYKVYLYIIFTLLSAYALGGVNLEKIMKKNRIIESRIIIILLSFIWGYIATNFITDFIEVSKII